MKKSRLKPEIVKQLLSSESLTGMLADKVKLKYSSVYSSIIRESQQLCLPHYQLAICEVLGLPAGSDITEVYTAEPVTE